MNVKSRITITALIMTLLLTLVASTAMAGDTFNLLTGNNEFDTTNEHGFVFLDPWWTLANKTGDKIDCSGKVTPNSGACAFRFKGGLGEASKLAQTISGSDLVDFQDFINDANVSVQMAYAVNSLSDATVLKAKTIVKLGNGTKIKSVANFSGTTMIGEFNNWESVNGTTVEVPQGSTVTSVKVNFANKSASGKAFIDDVNVYFSSLAS